MLEKKPLLSICIPTFNRVSFLQRLLASLLCQVELFKSEVEVIISDNASTDATVEYCTQLLENYPHISFCRNEVNEGSDVNISNLYLRAKGTFVWIIGDDDYLAPGALAEIITVLNSHRSTALVYINSISHGDCLELKPEKIDYIVFNENDEFIKKVGVFFTFISGVIINKEMHPVENDIINRYRKTSLIQLSWVYTALAGGSKFIFVNNKYVIAQPDNTGGYKLFTVFAENLTKITNNYFPVKSKENHNIRMSAMRFLLSFVGNNKFEPEDYIRVSDNAFRDIIEYKYFYHYIFRYPIFCKIIILKSKIVMRFRLIMQG